MKKTTKKMAVGGVSTKVVPKMVTQTRAVPSKAVPRMDQMAAAKQAAGRTKMEKPAPTIAQKAAPVANAAMGALSKMKFNAGGMAKKKKC
jgi:hypothetical protein